MYYFIYDWVERQSDKRKIEYYSFEQVQQSHPAHNRHGNPHCMNVFPYQLYRPNLTLNLMYKNIIHLFLYLDI